jgi:phosphohistidine phosphatase
MDLLLMQHGEALQKQEDPARPLSERGRREVERVARAAARLDLRVPCVRHSGKLRAQQTAEIVVAHLDPAPALERVAGLAPNDDPAAAVEALATAPAGTLVVGHLPHLSRLLSLLVVGDSGRALVSFRPGGLIGLGHEAEEWRLRLVLPPDAVAE